ncbi:MULTISPECIES: SRPBCC family protein [Kribbella]|uniref:Polyketide cyclase / dehydrase and lipid transport n=1 Tax=Kribbella sancticallisti TaxID=460087 RepID=A0ABN2EE26_9ACTN|nr:SRPBCC family protein [Kribbella catacumbae]
MTAIVNQIEVAAPAAEVFGYVTDPARFPEWQANVVGGRMDHETTIGAICSTTRRIGGRERDVTSTVTKYDPPTSWAVHGIDGPIRATVDVAVEPLPGADRTRLTISLDFEGHGIGKLLVPLLVRPQSRKEMQRNMTRLKARLEA